MFRTVDAEDILQVTSLSRSSSSHSDERDSHADTRVAKQDNNREFTFNMLIKEMIFCVALFLTAYGALHNTPTKISKHPQAVRFFDTHSLVTDWYKGQLSHALSYINDADISFVMYYAPWDAESQYVRDEFDKAATVLHDRVHFSAINCWNPGSECRLQNSKIPSWPILMAYTISGKGILYKGPRDAHSMVRFLELIIKPLRRVSSTEDLIQLLSVCDAVAVGYTPIKDSSKDYSMWYQVAVKSKEYDIIGEICFAVVTSEELAADLGVEITPTARLMLWNDTKEYNVNDDDSLFAWNETALVSWVIENFAQPLNRIIPLWKKSHSFDRFIDGNPILILFSPLNPLYEQIPAYDLLREIAMEYYNCKNNESNQWTAELMKLQQVQRLLYQQKDYDTYCKEYKFKTPSRKTSSYYKKEVVSHNNKYPWSNTTQKNQKNNLFDFLVKRGVAISKVMESPDVNPQLLDSLGLLQCSPVFPAEKSFYNNPPKCAAYEDNVELEQEAKRYWGSTETSMLPFDNDPLAPENLVQEDVKHFCNIMKFAKEWGPIAIPEKVDNQNITRITGLACENNFTLRMIAVDSVQNHHFAEALGIDIRNKKDMTTLVILDSKQQSQYVLSEAYSAKSVRDFIYNFTHKSLKRSYRTHVEDAQHTHYFGSEGKTEQMGINESTIHILDLTTKTFRRVVRASDQVTIVAVCGGSCYAHTTRAVVAAARLLRSCGVRVLAARLDARAHDLPHHYSPSHLPAILVFTKQRGAGGAGGEADSRAYPDAERVSPSGLVALALRSLGMPAHARVRLALCSRAKTKIEKKRCLSELNEHITSVIGRNLKYWRRTEDTRLKDAFLRRLYHLHKVSLDLSLLHTSDLNNPSKQNTLTNSLDTLSKHWDVDVSTLTKNVTVIEQS